MFRSNSTFVYMNKFHAIHILALVDLGSRERFGESRSCPSHSITLPIKKINKNDRKNTSAALVSFGHQVDSFAYFLYIDTHINLVCDGLFAGVVLVQ